MRSFVGKLMAGVVAFGFVMQWPASFQKTGAQAASTDAPICGADAFFIQLPQPGTAQPAATCSPSTSSSAAFTPITHTLLSLAPKRIHQDTEITTGVKGRLPFGPSQLAIPRLPLSLGRHFEIDKPLSRVARLAAAHAMLLSMQRARLLPEKLRKVINYEPPHSANSRIESRSISRFLRTSTFEPMNSACPSVYTGNSVIVDALAATGINQWWDYEEDALGGIGRYMVNVASGNLIIQADDMAVQNKGIEMALRRTYNALSSHDAAGDDGTPNLYGDKWTNTFDIHIAYNDLAQVNCQRGVTIFDIDGAHYDYAPIGDGKTFVNPAGQFAKLSYDGTSYYWTKKSGTEYVFWDINQTSTNVGYSGQIHYIFGRNVNNSLTMERTWTTDSSTLEHLHQMTVTAEDGNVSTLNFGDITGSGKTFRVLQNIVFPDGQTTVTYKYSVEAWQGSAGYDPVLTEVDEPGNNVASTLAQQYLYGNTSALMTAAYSPWWVLKPQQVGDGPAYTFGYGTFNNLLQIQYYGDVNPSISDGYSRGSIQSSPPPDFGYNAAYRTVSICYENVGGGGGCDADGGQTVWSDTDGHQTTYLWDSVGRVTQTQDTTGDPSGGPATLTSYQGWDSQNNLSFEKDPRSASPQDTTYETDYSYDSNGNTTMVAQPSVATDRGTFRPTARYTYDANNNNLAYCDPVFVHKVGGDYPNSYSCPTTYDANNHGPMLLVWTSQSYEPYGELTSMTSFTNYKRTLQYATGPQQGTDYGLLTQVTGTSFTELDNKTSVTPQQSFVYDVHGNVICDNLQSYSQPGAWWVLQYDSLNRPTGVGDEDDDYLSGSLCGKTTGAYHTASTTNYYQNGQIKQTQTASEYAQSVATTFTYDADGNQVTEVHHYDSVATTTTKYYDGADRLIEIELPLDNRKVAGPFGTMWTADAWGNNWLTRYFYDLTQGGQVSVGNSAKFSAYGNLFDTQEYVFDGGQNHFLDTKGTAYDALDRPVAKYYYQPGGSGGDVLQATSFTYDNAGDASFLSSSKDALGITTSYTYDTNGRESQISFSDGTTPSRTYVYEPDRRVASINEQPYGTLSYAYDPDGNKSQQTEPAQGGVTSPENPLTYAYYPNGWKSSISLTSAALNQSNLLEYIYREDAKRTGIIINAYGKTRNLNWNYTPAGRLTSTSDTWFNPATSYALDPYGLVKSYTISHGVVAGTMSNIVHDAEGNPTSETLSDGSINNLHTSIRGDFFLQWTAGTSTGSVIEQVTTNGASASYNGTCYPSVGCSAGEGQFFDELTAARIQDGTYIVKGECGNYTQYGYDKDGRAVSATNGFSTGLHCGGETIGSYAKTYDAENHLLGQQFTNWWQSEGGECGGNSYTGAGPGYSWGPNGHPITLTGPGYSATLHWDGDALLYTSTSNLSTGVDDVKIESLADIAANDTNYSDLHVIDRDLSGLNAIGFHNGTTTTGGSTCCATPYFYQDVQYNQSGSTQSGESWPTIRLFARRADGLSDGCNVIQGVRTYSAGLGSWTSADAYQGQPEDPLSQKPYAWDHNNPLNYEDSTGFNDTDAGSNPPPNMSDCTIDNGCASRIPSLGREPVTAHCGYICQWFKNMQANDDALSQAEINQYLKQEWARLMSALDNPCPAGTSCGVIAPGVGFDRDAQALFGLAREAARKGSLTLKEANNLWEMVKELKLDGRAKRFHGPMVHGKGAGKWNNILHMKINNIHIRITP